MTDCTCEDESGDGYCGCPCCTEHKALRARFAKELVRLRAMKSVGGFGLDITNWIEGALAALSWADGAPRSASEHMGSIAISYVDAAKK